ncbi:PH domain-containing protein [bacterium]|nr:MAG: PH domain-containing protein [bacterium]
MPVQGGEISKSMTDLKISTESSKPRLVCRPEQVYWVFVWIFGLLALIIPILYGARILVLKPGEGIEWLVIQSTLFGGGSLAFARYLIRCRIVADEDGLEVRGYFQRWFAPWDAIEDYELRQKVPNNSFCIAYVKAGGTWRALPQQYVRQAEVLERIAQEAKWSKANKWQRDDLRDDSEWPKTFVYSTESLWKSSKNFAFRLLFLVVLVFASILLPWIFFPVSPRPLWSDFPVSGVLFVAKFLLVIPVAIVAMTLIKVPALKARKQFQDQLIQVTPEYLSFTHNGDSKKIGWDEIKTVHLEAGEGMLQPNRYVITSATKRIEFVAGLANEIQFKALLKERARNAEINLAPVGWAVA